MVINKLRYIIIGKRTTTDGDVENVSVVPVRTQELAEEICSDLNEEAALLNTGWFYIYHVSTGVNHLSELRRAFTKGKLSRLWRSYNQD